MIYGSTGFTGRLIAQRAVEVGLAPVLAGRDEDRVRRQAEFLGTSWRTVSLDSIEALTVAGGATGIGAATCRSNS